MAERQVIIVGGGLAGVTIFYELAARNVPCLLVEAESRVARGTSYANGGGLHPSLPDPWNNPGIGPKLLASLFNRRAAVRLGARQIPQLLGWGARFLRHATPARHMASSLANFALAEYSTRQTEALQGALNLTYDQASPGTLKLLHSAAERDTALALADLLARQGLRYEELSRDALAARESALADARHVIGALYFPDDGIGDARVFCEKLTEAAVAQGGQIRRDAPVEKILSDNGRVTGIRLRNEELRGEVVLCAGVNAPKLAAPLGVSLPIRPAKGYSLTLDVPVDMKHAPQHALVDPKQHITVTPLGKKLRILGMAEFIGFDRQIDPQRLVLLREFFEHLMPNLAAAFDWQNGAGWAGLRPMSADGRPYIGESGVDGLWLNCGHGHLGWTMAVGSARILADKMTGRAPEINAAPFSFGPTRRA